MGLPSIKRKAKAKIGLKTKSKSFMVKPSNKQSTLNIYVENEKKCLKDIIDRKPIN